MCKGDLLYAPPCTAHIIVGAGDGPCAVVMVGTRKDSDDILYPVSEAARRDGASVEEETADPAAAYGDAWSTMELTRLPLPW